MAESDRQTDYWDRVAWEKEFTHPLDTGLLHRHAPEDARILDIGCGYGRICAELLCAGFSDLVGVDISSEMIRRGRELHPQLDLRVLEGDRLPFDDETFDAVLAFAVLTCIPSDEGQLNLISEARRVLKDDGILYLSAYPLQDGERNRKRYEAGAERHGTYGVFELAEGALVRHMDMAWLNKLLSPFQQLELRELDVLTMNGNAARIVQYIGRAGKELKTS